MSPEENTSAVYSVDGRTFKFRSPVTSGLLPGSYVTVATDGGHERLGQVLEILPVAGTEWSGLVLEGSGSLLTGVGPIRAGSLTPASPQAIRAGIEDLDSEVSLAIGSVLDATDVPAVLRPKGFGRHTLVCGQSGSGKTYAVGLVLEQLLHKTSLPIVILDPNSDYVGLGSLREQEEAGLDDVGYRQVKDRHDEISHRIQVFRRGVLRLWMGNLTARQQAVVLGLDPIRDAEEYDAKLRANETLGTTRYSPTDIRRELTSIGDAAARNVALRVGNLALERMDIWADDGNPALAEQLNADARAAVVDLGSLETHQEQSIVAAAVIGKIWENRRERRPVLLMIDEAHNICPQNPTDPSQALATEHLIAIAGEGRKYGIHLLLVTQRPSKLHENVLSQCDNLILMKMNSAADVDRLAVNFSAVPTALIHRASSFGLGEGLAYGKISPNPMIFRTGRRFTAEGGGDTAADWATPD